MSICHMPIAQTLTFFAMVNFSVSFSSPHLKCFPFISFLLAFLSLDVKSSQSMNESMSRECLPSMCYSLNTKKAFNNAFWTISSVRYWKNNNGKNPLVNLNNQPILISSVLFFYKQIPIIFYSSHSSHFFFCLHVMWKSNNRQRCESKEQSCRAINFSV